MSTVWTKIAKASLSVQTTGSPMGLLLAITYPVTTGTPWTTITKASGTAWTKIAKAT